MAAYELDVNRIEQDVSGWRDRLEKLREKADKAEARDMVELSKQLENLRSLVEDVERHIHEVKLARDESSDDARERLERAVQQTRSAFQKA